MTTEKCPDCGNSEILSYTGRECDKIEVSFCCGSSFAKGQQQRVGDKCRANAAEQRLAAAEAERDLLAGLLEQCVKLELPNGDGIGYVRIHDKTGWMIEFSGQRELYPTALAAIRAALAQENAK